jgi:fucose permease
MKFWPCTSLGRQYVCLQSLESKVLQICMFSDYALRVKRLWLSRSLVYKLWRKFQIPCSENCQTMFMLQSKSSLETAVIASFCWTSVLVTRMCRSWLMIFYLTKKYINIVKISIILSCCNKVSNEPRNNTLITNEDNT